MEPIKVLIADDHTLLRQGLRKILELDPKIEVVDEAGDGQGAINLVRTHSPHVVLMDINMPGVNGIEASKVIKREYPGTGVIVLTAHDNEEQIMQVIDAGVDGYILKDVNPDNLYHAIACVARGESVLNPSVMSKVLGQMRKLTQQAKEQEAEVQRPGGGYPKGSPISELTERERDVLKLIAQGASNKVIAEKLFISEKTVKNHITNIFRKLDVEDRTQAALFAIKHKVVEI